MRIGFALSGSRGDIQPGVAVAAALAARGHDVALAVPANLTDAVRRTGMPTSELCGDTADLLASPLVTTRLRSRNPVTRMRALREVGRQGVEQADRVVDELAERSDLLVTGPLGQERAATIAQAHGIAFTPLHLCPLRPNSSVSPLRRRLPAPATRALWRAVDVAYWASVAGNDRALRHSLGLSPTLRPLSDRLAAAGTTEIQAYDRALFPGLATEWGPRRPFTGFLVPDRATLKALNGDQTMIADDAITWIHDGEPPVYVGFGSMAVPIERLSAIVDWLTTRGLRVLAHTTHDIGSSNPAVHVATGGLDHDAVLPLCRGAVHHGGAGTTAAAARAGLPSVIGWFSADQPIWTHALARTGVGTGDRLSRLGPTHLELLLDPDAATSSQRLARNLIGRVDAVENACNALVDDAS